MSAGLCTVVPFSTTPPKTVRPFHYKLIDFDFLNAPFDSIEQWVKADMIYTVSFDRLNIPFNGKDEEGNRKRIYKILDEKDMKEIRKAVLAGLCINLQQFVDMDGD